MPSFSVGIDFLANTKEFQSKVKQAESSLKKAANNMKRSFQTVKMAAQVMTGMMVTGMALSTKSAMSFESQLANVATMLSDETMPSMENFKTGIKKMSVAFGESTETLAKGLYDILSASIEPAKALNVLAVSTRAAQAGLTDAGVAADAITTILNSYGYASERASEVSDKLFGVVLRGKITFGELAPNIGKVAATAAKVGVTLDELGAMIATMTRAGVRSEIAVTSLNAILSAFLSPSKQAEDAAKKMGLTLNTNTLRTMKLEGVMSLLKDATAEQTSEIFGNVRAMRGMMAAMGDSAGYAKDLDIMLNSAGLTQKAFAKNTNTTEFRVKQMTQKIKMLAVGFGEKLLPVVDWALQLIRQLIRDLEEAERQFGFLKDIAEILQIAIKGFVAFGIVVGTILGQAANTIMSFWNLAKEALNPANWFTSTGRDEIKKVWKLFEADINDVGTGIQERIDKVIVPSLNGAKSAAEDFGIASVDAMGKIQDAGIVAGSSIKAVTKEMEQFISDLSKSLETSMIKSLDTIAFSTQTFSEFMENLFKDLVTAIIHEFNRLLVLKLFGGILNWLTGGIAGLLGGIFGFQKGGIVPGGLAFEGFQGGGIVKRPTLALMGEDKKDEAVIPLEDGRVPVEMKGKQTTNIINVYSMHPGQVNRVMLQNWARVLEEEQKKFRRRGI